MMLALRNKQAVALFVLVVLSLLVLSAVVFSMTHMHLFTMSYPYV